MLFIYFCSDIVLEIIQFIYIHKYISIHRHINSIHTLIHLQLYFIYRNHVLINGNTCQQVDRYRQICMYVHNKSVSQNLKTGNNQLQLTVLGILLFFQHLSFLTYHTIILQITQEQSIHVLPNACRMGFSPKKHVKHNDRGVENQCSCRVVGKDLYNPFINVIFKIMESQNWHFPQM